MSIHCEKLVKKLVDKYFKSSTKAQSSNSLILIEKNTESKADYDKGDSEDDETEDTLNLQEKVIITDKIRKLSNEGLASVNDI